MNKYEISDYAQLEKELLEVLNNIGNISIELRASAEVLFIILESGLLEPDGELKSLISDLRLVFKDSWMKFSETYGISNKIMEKINVNNHNE